MRNFRPRIAARVNKRVESCQILRVPAGERFLAELPDEPFTAWALGDTPEGAEQALWLKLYEREDRRG